MSSNTNIGNTPVNQGYVQLIHMGETGGIDGTLRALYDGDGTASDLLIASDKVKISTTLYIGSKTLTEFVQDTVGTMFSSNTETNITVTYQDADGTIDLVSSGEVTLTGSETLTNKTLTSPVINTGISGSAILDSDTMSGASATKLSSSESIKAYVDTEVAGIVSSAPSTLDTLNELAAALGDDANFSTTVTNSIATKLPLAGGQMTGNITFSGSQTVDGRDVSADGSKLDGIEASATADQSNAEIRTAVEAATDSNVFTDADHTKLNAIEASADVTDTANVTSAGALMDSEVDADIKTLSLPANTTISATAKTLLDDANTTNMRTTLGLDIGSDVQAFDLGLANIAGLTTVADKMIYTTASDVYATTTLSAVARTLLDDSTTANMLTTLGLTATAAELNYTDGVSSNIQTQLGTKVPTTRTITPVSLRGISGGGDLSADRTFELSKSQLSQVTLDAADTLILFDAADDVPKRFLAQDIFDSLGGITIDGTTANGLLTYGGTNNIDTEANLTFDGSTLALTGDLNVGSGDFFVDDSTGKIGIGTTSPDATLQIGENSTSFTLGTTSGNSIDLLKLATDSTNENQLIFSSERVADGSTWTTTRERIRRKVDGSDMGYIQFGSSFSASVADMISFGEVGVGDYMGITGDGKVGIATNSPTAKLQIGGGTDGKLFYTDGLYNDVTFNGGSGGTSGVWEFVNSGTWGQTRFYVQDANNSADRLTFDFRGNGTANKILAGTSTGNVGIGTASPQTTLHLSNTTTAPILRLGNEDNSIAAGADLGVIQFYSGDDSGGGNAIKSTISSIQPATSPVSGELVFKTTLSTGSLTEAMRIDGSGNVGIGTTSPNRLLHLQSTGDAVMQITSADGSGAYIDLGDVSDVDGGRIVYDSGSNLLFNTASTEKVRITSAGNVGIGTASPGVKLDVAGQARTTNGMLVNNGTTAGFFTTDSDNVNFGSSTSGKGLKLFSANAEKMRIDSSGHVLIGGTSVSGHGFNLEVLNDHAFVKGPDGWNGSGDKAIVALGSAVSNESFGCGYVYGTGMILSTYKSSGGGAFGSSTQNSLIIADTTGKASFINDVVAYASSDKRLKENVKPLDNALDKIE